MTASPANASPGIERLGAEGRRLFDGERPCDRENVAGRPFVRHAIDTLGKAPAEAGRLAEDRRGPVDRERGAEAPRLAFGPPLSCGSPTTGPRT